MDKGERCERSLMIGRVTVCLKYGGGKRKKTGSCDLLPRSNESFPG